MRPWAATRRTRSLPCETGVAELKAYRETLRPLAERAAQTAGFHGHVFSMVDEVRA